MAVDEITSLLIDSKNTCRAVLPDGYNPGSDDAARTISVNAFDVRESLVASATPSPNPTAVLAREITIPVGLTVDLDLTDAPIIGAEDADGEPADGEDLTAKKAFRLVFDTRGGGTDNNSAGVTIKPHTTNGYNLFGGATGLVILPPNARVEFLCLDGSLPAISSTACVIQFAGAENDVVRVFMVFETPAA